MSRKNSGPARQPSRNGAKAPGGTRHQGSDRRRTLLVGLRRGGQWEYATPDDPLDREPDEDRLLELRWGVEL